jgi:hypothetical protein
MINSFGRDPLICSKCKEEMLLWRIWHPKYGEIFDLSKDGPFEYDIKEKKIRQFKINRISIFN